MSIFAPVIIIILAMVIQSLLQLSPATFTLFYHSALAKHSKKKADDLSLSYIFGLELFCAILFITIYYIVISPLVHLVTLPSVFYFIMAGVCLAESIALCFFYFRKSAATALFLSRRIAANLTRHASRVKTRTDAISLGFYINVPELPFTLPLYLLSAISIVLIPHLAYCFIVIPFIIIAAIPLFVLRGYFRSGHNLAFITRTRTKLKPFFRITLALCYLLLMLILIYLGVSAS